jgi:hypothetical protein
MMLETVADVAAAIGVAVSAAMKFTTKAMATLVLVATLAGCGGSSSGSETPRSKATRSDLSHTSTPTATAPAAIGSPAEEARHEGPGTVPNEVGLRLHTAENNLKQREIPFRVIRLGASAQYAASRLTVCSSNPAPRSHLESGTIVRLAVAHAC